MNRKNSEFYKNPTPVDPYNVTDPAALPPKKHRLSAELKRLGTVCDGRDLTLSRLVRELRARGHALITLFFALPFMLPIPMPGLSIALGAIIMVCGVRIAFRSRPWIPRRWRGKKIHGSTLKRVFSAAEKIMLKLEKLIRPRGIGITSHPVTTQACGWMIAVCGLLLSLPYPPGTNFPPAIAILLLSIGVLEEDVVFVVLGFVGFLFNLAFFTAITLWGVEGAKWLMDKIF